MDQDRRDVVVWDFDGPIIESRDLTFGLRQIEYPELTIEGYIEMHESNFFSALRERGYKKSGEIDYLAQYASGILGIAPVEGVAETIRQIAEGGFQQSIVSGNEGRAIEAYLERYAMKTHLPYILGSDFSKSKVEKFAEALRRHGVGPEQVLYVTDTPGDVREARELGIDCIAISWGFCPREMLMRASPARFVESPHEVLSAVLERFRKAD
ncbi:hypothetical protein A3F27_00605 [Candidatus Kaiserbacteria bacterium RIFCSPHIGHO2_12_FULL_53_13]|uniref:Phosphatase n=1 Tax=Candidatus Kaiserbacteria bacterium RIFCSPHIGHO2_12_FULL_53_13 TaxID=1798502 RepID=A0A1F6E9J6_9BACT|nr:MAG: hypothetical protein A3F27_00605 [Candidatus Kaiserbacteria bacterium RIFCSPHIGHO2_12_FULL_53_13]